MPNLVSLSERVRQLDADVIGLEANATMLREQVSELEQQRADMTQRQQDLRLASILIETAASEARLGLKERFEEVVSVALRSVFGSDYSFLVLLSEKRNATWADFAILSAENKEPQDPIFSRGGSTIDVCSIALRLMYLEIAKMPGPLLLDEPARMVGEQHQPAMIDMLQSLQQMTGRQFILITHWPMFKEAFPNAVEID